MRTVRRLLMSVAAVMVLMLAGSLPVMAGPAVPPYLPPYQGIALTGTDPHKTKCDRSAQLIKTFTIEGRDGASLGTVYYYYSAYCETNWFVVKTSVPNATVLKEIKDPFDSPKCEGVKDYCVDDTWVYWYREIDQAQTSHSVQVYAPGDTTVETQVWIYDGDGYLMSLDRVFLWGSPEIAAREAESQRRYDEEMRRQLCGDSGDSGADSCDPNMIR